MGRHGTGGSEDANEQGDSAFWGPDNQQSDSFWGRGEKPEPPGWPSLPDQPEVTGQWAPMPKRDTPPQAAGPQSDPFETTGAFAVPPRPGADHGHPPDEQPFETTGAFARPPSWDDVQDSTQTFGQLPPDGFDRTAGPGSAGPHGAFPPNDPFAQRDAQDPFGAGAQGGFQGQQGDPFGANDSQGFRQDDPFARRDAQNDPFGAGDPQGFRQDDPFGTDTQGGFRGQGDPFGSGDAHGFRQDDPFAQGETQGFRQGDPFGAGGSQAGQDDPFGAEATGRFEAPGLPPEPGDVKVAGEPTMAARTPAWAEAETGFLGSGWSGGEQDAQEEPRRGRRKQKDPDALDAPTGGRGRMALLSVAAVVVVLGGTVAGIQMMSSDGDPGCPGGRCAAVQGTEQPAPTVSEPVAEEPSEPEEDEETPADEPTEEETRPQPTRANTQAPAPRRTSTPTPTPTRTKSKAPVQERVDEPAVEEIPDEVTEEPTQDALDGVDNGSVPTQGVPQPVETPSDDPTSNRPLSGSATSVNVRFKVNRQQLTSYTATMSVTNDSRRTLSSFTLSMPVRGKVVDVTGAEWSQDGNLLIVEMDEPIATGDTADLRISAKGRAGSPQSCGLVGGECQVT